MSYSITGTTITLTRGDTFEALVSATKKDGTPYIPVEGDVIRFAMKENYDDARPLLVKEIPIDTMMLMLEPSDTADLNFGKYVYDIQLTKANGKAMIDALGIGDYVKTTVMNTELAKKVDKVDGSRLMTTAEGTKLAGIAEGAQVNVIEKIKVNGVERTVTEKAVDVSVPTGALASLDKVTEENLDSALKAKVNAAAEGNHSHANKTVLDGITSEKVAAWDAAEQNAKNYVDGLVASNDEVTAICTEVFGTASI